MSDFSNLVDSATTSVSNAASSAVDFVSSGVAGGLSAIAGAAGGLVSSLTSGIKPLSGIKLPLANPLFAYASYDYILGIASITNEQLNNPDKGYMGNTSKFDWICKSANIDPGNRVQTAFGKFDFYIDKLEINSSMGMEGNSSSNMLNMSFDIIEPYSMGIFLMAIEEAAWKNKHDNYTMAPYLLTIDFRGNTETGKISTIPQTSRKIPFKFLNIEMTVNEHGSVYHCECTAANGEAHSAHNSEIKTDVSVKGITVQEVLQTGEKSLQVVINQRLKDQVKKGIVKTPDQIFILFPKDISSSAAGSTQSKGENSSGATISTSTMSAITQQLHLVQSKVPGNNTFVQDPANVNELGKAKMGFSDTRKGDAPVGKDNKVIDSKGNVIRSNNTVDPKISDIRFSQDTDIPTAINQVLLNSEYASSALGEAQVTKDGMKVWWRIDTQVFIVSDNSNEKTTGRQPRIIVYRVVPYEVHSTKLMAPNTKASGFTELKKQIVKEYNYIYTGKNVDVIRFNLSFKTSFAAIMGATAIDQTADAKLADSDSAAEPKLNNSNPLPDGQKAQKGTVPSQVRYTGTKTKSDNKGGGGLETPNTRAARLFHDAVNDQSAMQQLEMDIIGDPYYIAQSGNGNYTAKPSQYKNLNSDMTINHQNGEVHIVINFRTPVDLNQATGLYDFGKSTKSAPVLMWSGFYHLLTVTSKFAGGQFTQTLKGNRVPSQEFKGTGSASNTFNVNVPEKAKVQEPSK